MKHILFIFRFVSLFAILLLGTLPILIDIQFSPFSGFVIYPLVIILSLGVLALLDQVFISQVSQIALKDLKEKIQYVCCPPFPCCHS